MSDNKKKVGTAMGRFCPKEGCNGLLLLVNKESKLRRCIKCRQFWKYEGKDDVVVTNKAPEAKEREIEEREI